jgi:hypothetical protein
LAYSDPQSVTISAVPISLPRVSSGENAGSFKSSDGLTELKVQHSFGRRTRNSIRLISTKISADPFIPAQNVRVSSSVTLVVDHPNNGYTAAELKAMADALVAYLAASSGAKVTQLVGGEN